MVTLSRTPSVSAKLSVVVPCYNEERSLRASIERLHTALKNECQLEIIIVDDHSEDKSLAIAEALAHELGGVEVLRHATNQGKGAALRSGFDKATGDVLAIHDADLEYNPQDLKRMFFYLVENRADVVFGTRFQPREARRAMLFWHTLANSIITLWCNMWTNLNLTDIECCYKLFTRAVYSRIAIEENRFGVEPELVAKCAHMKLSGRALTIYEMGIDYHGRSYDEGKKIGIKDAFRALWVIAKYNFMLRFLA